MVTGHDNGGEECEGGDEKSELNDIDDGDRGCLNGMTRRIAEWSVWKR